MLYLGIDQHKAQLTINLRNEQGDVILQRQVSTDHAKINAFFVGLRERAVKAKGFMAILEVCGFNDWLLRKLEEYDCKEIVLMQPDNSSRKKTDRRDANALCELLWNNRSRLKNGEMLNGIRRVILPNSEEAMVRQLSNLRQFLVRQRVKSINRIRSVLRKHNLEHDAPTKSYKTKKYKEWLKELKFERLTDNMEIEIHIKIWETLDEQILRIEHEMAKHAENNENVLLLVSIPGITHMGAITLLSRMEISTVSKLQTALLTILASPPDAETLVRLHNVMDQLLKQEVP